MTSAAGSQSNPTGRHDARVDDRYRIKIPDSLHAQFAGPLTAVLAGDSLCFRLYQPARFEQMIAAISSPDMELWADLDPHRNLLRTFLNSGETVTPDAQHRFVIPPPIRAALRIEPGDMIVMLGQSSRVEVWRREDLRKRLDEAAEKPDVFRSALAHVSATLAHGHGAN